MSRADNVQETYTYDADGTRMSHVLASCIMSVRGSLGNALQAQSYMHEMGILGEYGGDTELRHDDHRREIRERNTGLIGVAFAEPTCFGKALWIDPFEDDSSARDRLQQ